MSCLLGDLPARLVFLFFIFSVLFGGRPSLRFLASTVSGYEEEDARLVVYYYLAAFVGRPDEIRRLLQSSQPPQRVTLMGGHSSYFKE